MLGGEIFPSKSCAVIFKEFSFKVCENVNTNKRKKGQESYVNMWPKFKSIKIFLLKENMENGIKRLLQRLMINFVCFLRICSIDLNLPSLEY